MNRIVADSVILSNIESKSNVVVLETGHGLMVLVLSGTWEILVLTWTLTSMESDLFPRPVE